MNLEDLYAIVEEKYYQCEGELDSAYDDPQHIKKIEGCMEAFQLVMKLIEESHREEEL